MNSKEYRVVESLVDFEDFKISKGEHYRVLKIHTALCKSKLNPIMYTIINSAGLPVQIAVFNCKRVGTEEFNVNPNSWNIKDGEIFDIISEEIYSNKSLIKRPLDSNILRESVDYALLVFIKVMKIMSIEFGTKVNNFTDFANLFKYFEPLLRMNDVMDRFKDRITESDIFIAKNIFSFVSGWGKIKELDYIVKFVLYKDLKGERRPINPTCGDLICRLDEDKLPLPHIARRIFIKYFNELNNFTESLSNSINSKSFNK